MVLDERSENIIPSTPGCEAASPSLRLELRRLGDSTTVVCCPALLLLSFDSPLKKSGAGFPFLLDGVTIVDVFPCRLPLGLEGRKDIT